MIEFTSTTRGLLPPLKTKVLVVGSGAAGLVAALAAGRNGADVTLLEYQGFVGGICAEHSVRLFAWTAMKTAEPILLKILPEAPEGGADKVDEEGSIAAAAVDNHHFAVIGDASK